MGAQGRLAEAQFSVNKMCLEQQLMQSILCGGCSMPGSNCCCAPGCGPSGYYGSSSDCCVTAENVTWQNITHGQALATIQNVIDKNLTFTYKDEKSDDGKVQAAITAIFQGNKSAATVKAALGNLTSSEQRKRFAVYLIVCGAPFISS